jgi:mRNA interferase MazF
MIKYNSGDIVLLKFPFSDTSNIKKRPALVILDTEDNDIIAARITTQLYSTKYDVLIRKWETAGLLALSVIRSHKIAALDKSLVERKLGTLCSEDFIQFKNIFNKYISL